MVKWKIIRFEEGREFIRGKGFPRFKRAIFEVNGAVHTIKISMKDFEEDKSSAIIEREVQKITAALEGSGSGTGK